QKYFDSHWNVQDRTVEVFLRQRPHLLPALRTGPAPAKIIHRRMNAAPNPGKASLVRGVIIGRPLQLHRLAWALLKAEPVSRLYGISAQPTREKGGPGHRRQHF